MSGAFRYLMGTCSEFPAAYTHAFEFTALV